VSDQRASSVGDDGGTGDPLVAFVGLVATLLGTFVTYGLFGDRLLAVTAGACWGLGGALSVRERAVWTTRSGDLNLANALPGVLIVLVGTFGLHPGLPLSLGLRSALLVLVAGVVLVAANAGILLGRRARR
jgi:hypothetical protein